MRVVAPRLGAPKYVAGPPKRFAQGMGAAFTTSAAVLAIGFGADTAAGVLTVLLVVAATLESVFALCLGCQVFALLMRLGLVPEETCERCANIWATAPEADPARPETGDRPVYSDGHNPWGRQASTWSIRRGGCEPRFRAAS